MNQRTTDVEHKPSPGWVLWAKWCSHEGISSYHPLLCHLLDVACVVECQWETNVPMQWKTELAHELAMEPDRAREWLMFLAGMHDIGKASPGFQTQLPGKAGDLVQHLLQNAGLPWQKQRWVPHALVSALTLRNHYEEQTALDEDSIDAVAMLVGGHHGLFPSLQTLHNSPYPDIWMGLTGKWANVRATIIADFCDLMGISPKLVPGQPLSTSAAMRLAGLISVADWIASSAADFPLLIADAAQPQPVAPADYLAQARQRARAALQRLGWQGWRAPDAPASFSTLFPTLTPRHLQQTVIDIAPVLTSPTLVVIEAPMGEGKTEAALFLADRWCAADGGRGLFFALPTQATSTSMFNRVHDFLAQRFPADVVTMSLLHGHAALSSELADLQSQRQRVLEASAIYDDPDGNVTGAEEHTTGAVIATEWFASSKRALLAPFGVGTIDQGLMAALPVKHGFVRHLGLSTKTVVIDEVHSYDIYMTTLLKRLIEWLGAHRVPVVLLSATLPNQRRQELLAAYAHGAAWENATERALDVSYPRISWVTETGMHTRAIQASPRPTVQVQRLDRADPTEPEADIRDAEKLVPVLREALQDGGCVAVICNTVNRAQKIFHVLQDAFARDTSITLELFHARFPYEQRAAIEKRIVEAFGKQQGARPQRAILVATQVIEQSLDLDFDFMVTDLAPVDLLLQRLGRLHRHARPSEELAARPQRLAQPRCLVFMPPLRNECPLFAYADAHVYNKHVLLRSWHYLRERDHLNLPGDIEAAIEAVYDTDVLPENLSPLLLRYWQHTHKAMLRANERDEQWAKDHYIRHPLTPVPLERIMGSTLTEDRPELHPARQALTRNADPSITVICLSGTEEHPHLRPNGPPITLNNAPDFALTRELLMRSVTLSQRDIVKQLEETPAPLAWQKVALLRHCRPLFFNDAGIAFVGKRSIRLDPFLGITYPSFPSPQSAPNSDSE